MINLMPDSLQNPFMGILKPLDKGTSALKSYFIIYYILGLPFTYFLAYKMQLWTKGLWLGFMASVTVNDISLLYIMFSADWK
jgi:MATE family multidrug resistance protein